MHPSGMNGGHRVLNRELAVLLLIASLTATSSAEEREAFPPTTKAVRERVNWYTGMNSADLERNFANPPMDCRPWVRYWWRGIAVTREELARQLKGMAAQGLGGVEITFFTQPPPSPVAHHTSVQFASSECFDRVAICVEEAAKVGLGVDVNPTQRFMIRVSGKGTEWCGFDQKAKSVAWESTELKGPMRFEGPLPEWQDKQRGESRFLAATLSRIGPGDADKAVAEPARVVADALPEDGRVGFDVPEGTWRLTRFHVVLNNRHQYGNTDVMNARTMARYMEWFVTPIVERVGDLAGPTFRGVYIDSPEFPHTTWSASFREEFRRRRGYDLVPYLPLLCSSTSGNLLAVTTRKGSSAGEAHNRLIHDFQRTRGELEVDHFLNTWRDWLNDRGMLLRPNAMGTDGDLVDAHGAGDIPELEYMIQGPMEEVVPRPHSFHDECSGAHTYGRNLVSVEAFTGLFGKSYDQTLRDARIATDFLCSLGVNNFVMHGYSYSPPEAGIPGWCFHKDIILGDTSPLWPYFRPVADYITRSSFLQRSGRWVSDLCVYRGTLSGKQKQGAPRLGGRQSDRITDRLLNEHARMDGGRLRVGLGAYRVLLLDTAAPDVETLATIEGMVQEGLNVVATVCPSDVPGFHEHEPRAAKVREIAARLLPEEPGLEPRQVGDGKTWLLASRDALESVFEQLQIPPQISRASASLNDRQSPIRWQHRAGVDFDMFSLANGNLNDAVTDTFRFRAQGKVEIWDPHTGRGSAVPFAADGPFTTVKLEIPALGARYVILRRDKPAVSPAPAPAAKVTEVLRVPGPWTVTFAHIDRRPAFRREFERLEDWTTLDDELKFFSGTGSYEAVFDLKSIPADGALALDLGEVCDVARVFVNDRECGVVYEPPYRVELQNGLAPGENRLRVDVGNRYENAIIKLRREGQEIRNRSTGKPSATPHKSGLLGPVRLMQHRGK